MSKILFLFTLICPLINWAQSYAPAPGISGSTAIYKDSSCIVSWASGIEITRGSLDISTPTLGVATFGDGFNALGAAEGDGTSVVSLGDSGIAIITFSSPITNGSGADFAIFENGFADDYMEFAHVEVSSDGLNFVRFPSHSESPVIVQLDNFMFGDCRMVNNLAGKYRQGYGTPFDLEELLGNPLIDLNSITHLKLIDVIGSISPGIGTTDAHGNLINDPFPTPFESCGFDLDAVGVIHQLALGFDDNEIEYSIYPNPTVDEVYIKGYLEGEVRFFALNGTLIHAQKVNGSNLSFDVHKFGLNSLILEIATATSIQHQRIQVLNID